jgi:hypothetical protein
MCNFIVGFIFTVETAEKLGFDYEAASNKLTLAKNYGEEGFD